jgi:hypothetical protein
VDEVLHLEGERDALAAELQRAQQTLQQQQQQQLIAPAAGSEQQPQRATQEQQLFELQLQRDQAQAALGRLRARLDDLFGPGASDPGAARPHHQQQQQRPRSEAPGGGGADAPPATARRASSGAVAGGGGVKLSGREAELLSTVDNLRAALERAMAGSTPTTRFMQARSLDRAGESGSVCTNVPTCTRARQGDEGMWR